MATYAQLPVTQVSRTIPPRIKGGHFSDCAHAGEGFSTLTHQRVYKVGQEAIPSLTTSNPFALFPDRVKETLPDGTRVFDPFKNKDEMIKEAVKKQSEEAAKRGKASKKKERENCKLGTEYSTLTRGDIEHTVTFGDQQCTVMYNMVYNSEMNGVEYFVNGAEKPERVEGAVSSSLSRDASKINLLRQMRIKDEAGIWHTVCCAGRPDSPAKIRDEYIRNLFISYFNPETGTGRGIRCIDADKDHYEMDLASISLISTFALPGIDDEARIIEGQYKDLQDFLDAGGTVTFELDGKTYTVTTKIWFLERQFNFMNRLEENLSPAFSGKQRAEEMTDDIELLEAMINREVEQHGEPANIAQIRHTLEILKQHRDAPFLTPMQELFSFLFVLQILPHNINCRSSCDRTGILVTLDLALAAWQKMGLGEIPENPYELLNNEEFKKLWFSMLPPAVLMSLYSRNTIGLKWQTKPVPYITIHPAALELMPQDALTEFYLGNPELQKFRWHHIFTALVPLAILRSPIKSMTHCWFHSINNSNVKNPIARFLITFARFLITLLVQPVIAALALGIFTTELALTLVLGTLWGLFTLFSYIWLSMGLIDKNSALAKYADPEGLVLGFSLVWSILFDLPTSKGVKDSADVAGMPIMFKKQKKDQTAAVAKKVTFDVPKRILPLDGDSGTVGCVVYGDLSKTFPRISLNGRAELATRSLLGMQNLTAARGPRGSSMMGPTKYLGNLEDIHKYHYTVETVETVEGPIPVFYRHPIVDGPEAIDSRLKPFDPSFVTPVGIRWVSGEQVDLLQQVERGYGIESSDLRHSLFLHPGLLQIDHPKSLVRLQYFDPRGVDLSSFKARLVKNDEPFQITSTPIPAKDDYRVVTYLYEPGYADWQVQSGSGLFLERHDFSQTMSPATPNDKGFVVLGRLRKKPDELAPVDELELIGVQIPYGYTLIIDKDCIHGDSTLNGLFTMAMTWDHTTMRSADTVFLKHPATQKNISMTLDGAPEIPFDPSHQVPPPHVVYKDEPLDGFWESTHGKNFIWNPRSRGYRPRVLRNFKAKRPEVTRIADQDPLLTSLLTETAGL